MKLRSGREYSNGVVVWNRHGEPTLPDWHQEINQACQILAKCHGKNDAYAQIGDYKPFDLPLKGTRSNTMAGDTSLLLEVTEGVGVLQVSGGEVRLQKGDWAYIPQALAFRMVSVSDSTEFATTPLYRPRQR